VGALGHVEAARRKKREGFATGSVGLVCLLAVMMFLPTAGAARASPSVACPSPTVAQVVSEVSEIPKGSQQIFSVWWTFTNLEDLEVSGYYWALDSGIITSQAWQAPDGSFYALESVGLLWQTYAGALSPVAGTPEPKNGLGPEVQAEFYHITATLTLGSMSTHGYLGNINLGGSKADILKAPGPQVGTGSYDPFTQLYFNNYAGFADIQDQLSWAYFYLPNGQEYCGTLNFITFALAWAGDIVT